MRLIFFDVETTTENETEKEKPQVFKLGTANLVNYRTEGSFTVVERFQWTVPEYFYDFVINSLHKRQITYILSANIWFDIRNSGLFMYLMKMDWQIKTFHSKGFTNIIKVTKSCYTIMFLNMQQLIPVSVKSYGEMIGMEKLEVDLENVTDAKLMTYCQRDTDIITEVFHQWLDFIRTNELGKFGVTLASQAMIAYRHKFLSHEVFIHKNSWLTRLERECYYGGRTEIFYKGRVKDGTIYALDVNSMYPYCMREHAMPVKWVGSEQYPTPRRLRKLLNNYICLTWVALDTSEPAYPCRLNKRLCFPIGKFLTYLTQPELEYAHNNGDIVGVDTIVYFEKAVIFRDYVDFFHKLKLKYEAEGNKAYRFMTKRLMNSLYGKFGQKIDVIFFEDTVTEERYGQHTVIDSRSGISYKELVLGKNRKVFQEGVGEGHNSFVAIPAHITGLARMELWRLIKKAGRENVYYCDTDSLYVNSEGYSRLQSEIQEGVLGKLSLEKESDNVIIHAPKDYIFAGVPTTKGIKPGTRQNKDGGYENLQFPGFRDDLKSGLENPYKIKKVTKHLTRLYKKGEVLDNGKVVPYTLAEY